ncbi:hypothetical protein [Salinifilum aidingensis]
MVPGSLAADVPAAGSLAAGAPAAGVALRRADGSTTVVRATRLRFSAARLAATFAFSRPFSRERWYSAPPTVMTTLVSPAPTNVPATPSREPRNAAVTEASAPPVT